MAAFVSEDPRDRKAFRALWTRILTSTEGTARTVLVGGRVAGYVLVGPMFGRPSVAYWLGTGFWGRGVATAALKSFLRQVRRRPLYARVAKDNRASQRVLEHAGFRAVESSRGMAHARKRVTPEWVYRLSE